MKYYLVIAKDQKLLDLIKSFKTVNDKFGGGKLVLRISSSNDEKTFLMEINGIKILYKLNSKKK